MAAVIRNPFAEVKREKELARLMAAERGQRQPAEDAHLSLEAVTEAITAVMRASNPVGSADEAMAARLGALIRPQLKLALGNTPVSDASLAGQSAFRTILSQHFSGPGPLDEEARNAARDYLLRHANRTSAEFAALVSQYLKGGGWNGRQASPASGSNGDSSASASSARLDAISRSDTAFLARMRGYALSRGLGWASENHEILRLGPGAIDTLVTARLTGEEGKRRFAGMKSVGFTNRETLNAARWVADNKEDGKEVLKRTEDSVRLFGGDDPARQKHWRDMFNGFYANPDNEEARKPLREALRQKAQHGTREEKAQAEKTGRLLRLEERARATADAKVDGADAKDAKADVREAGAVAKRAGNDDLLAGLSDTPGAQPAEEKPKTPAAPSATAAKVRSPVPGR